MSNENMRYLDLEEDALVCRQLKDEDGVCIIPDEQHAAAEAWLAQHGRKMTHVSSGQWDDKLRFHFEPMFTLEEAEALE